MFVQMASDAPDSFSWMFTKDIKAGTTVTFTDHGWDSTNFWRVTGTDSRMTENSIVWTAPTDIAAGIINQYTGSALAFATGGDNIFAIQGSWLNPEFISGTTWSNATTWLTTGSASTNNSYLPSPLVQGTSAFGSGINNDNVAYTGATTSGTLAALRTAIYGTPANWTGNETTVLSPTAGPYTITDKVAAADATSTVAFYDFGLNGTEYSTAATQVNGTDGDKISFGAFANAQIVSGGSLALDIDGKDGFNNQGYGTETTSTAFGTNPTLSLTDDAAFQFSMTVDTGYKFDLEYAEFWAARNANGPESLALYYSDDSGTTWNQIGSNLALGGTTWGAFSFDDTSNIFTDWTGTVDFRIYAWDAVGGTGQQIRFDEVYISGITSVIPEPTSAMAGLLLGAGLLRRRRRCA
jgi:hypothetical protein